MSTIELRVMQIATGSMRVIWDAPIAMADGTILRPDILSLQSLREAFDRLASWR
jgi:hypothetical protein